MTELRLYVALYADSDVNARVVEQVRDYGYDITSANELSYFSLSDEEQLTYATSQGRAILTYNVRHFEPLHQLWWNRGQSHSGIIVAPQIWGIGGVVRRLLKLLNTLTAEELVNNYVHLGQYDPAP